MFIVKFNQSWRRHAGFTMVEIIIVIGVMAVLATLTTPAIIQMMQKRDQESERLILIEITEALGRYALQNNEIPSDNPANNPGGDDWATLLASYTNYSQDQLRNDTWGNPRAYISHEESEVFLSVDITIGYATIHSRGVDRAAEAGTHIATGSVIDGFRVYGDRTSSAWWSNQANEVQVFGEVESGGDDLMVKFTNYQIVVDNYHTTLERFRAVAGILGTYAQAKYTEALAFDNALPDGHASKDPNVNIRLYYPPSLTQAGGDSALYSNYVQSDMANFSFGADGRVYSRNNNQLRRDEMVQLMRLIGLPDSYCCSALERFTTGGESYEMPFYYFSNPRPRGASGCGTRPSTRGDNLPPRLVLEVDSNTCG